MANEGPPEPESEPEGAASPDGVASPNGEPESPRASSPRSSDAREAVDEGAANGPMPRVGVADAVSSPATPVQVLLGEERLPPPAATPRPPSARTPIASRAAVGSTPRPASTVTRSASRPSVSGPELRPIPRAPVTRRGEGAPAAPRAGAGIAYPMPGEDTPSSSGGLASSRSDGPASGPKTRVGSGGVGSQAGLRDDAGYAQGPAPLRPTAHLSPQMTAIFGGLFGLATVTSVVALLIQVVPPRNERALASGSASASAASASPSSRPEPVVKKRVRVPIPGPWRLAELEKEPGVVIDRGTMDRKPLFDVLGEKGIPKSEVYRIIKALDGVRTFDKSKRKDRFAVAFDRSTKKVRAFEYEVTPSEIYQAREGTDGLLAGSKLDMKLAEEEYSGSVYLASDRMASFRAAGFEEGILPALDEALAGHMSTESFEEGGTVRVIAVEETALGLFSRYKRIVAMEYRPPDPSAKPVRIYTFNGQEAHGYWDDKGHQPHGGGWRSPCPGAPVTSHFNPKRLHPILHTVMPHQGTDFGAPMGTPVYAAYKGVVGFVGPHGATGNWVAINHPNGIETGYAHLSRFAAGLKVGDKVGTHQLVGYVGSTGRSTGPHLHFSARKNGVFFDALTLHLDGDRPVPTIDRGAFLEAKGNLDRRLDAIALPEPPPPSEKPAAAASASAEPAEAPAVAVKEKDGHESKGPKRSATQVGSPEALAAARAEPGIHPSQLVEVKGEDEDDESPAGSATGSAAAAPAPHDKSKADPSDPDDDDEK